MKNFILGLIIFSTMTFPSLSYAQVPFGGYDVFMFPITCSIPPFVPVPCQTVPLPPLFFFDLFAPLYIGSAVPIAGILAIPIGVPLTFPGYALFPGLWALGVMTPPPASPIGGFFIPSFPTPFGCIPPTSLCIPIAPSLGTVTPATGAAAGGFGF